MKLSGKWTWGLDVGAVVFAALVSCLYLTGSVLDGDEAIFAAIGVRSHVLDLPIYEAGWEPKPPGIAWVYSWAMAPFSRTSLLGPHILNSLVWVASAGLIGWFSRRQFGARAFAPAVVVYTLMRSYGSAKAGAANAEAIMQLPLVCALWWIVLPPTERRRTMTFLGGVALGCGVLLKTPVALYGPAAVLAVWVLAGWREALRAALFGGAGAFAVLAAEGLREYLFDDWLGAWLCNVEANRVYVEFGPRQSLAERLGGLWREFSRVPAPWLLVLVGLGTALIPFDRGRARAAAACAVLIACGLYIVSMGGYFFRHYWLMVHPVAAFAATAGVLALIEPRSTRLRTWAPRVVLTLLVLLLWVPAQRQDKRWLLRDLERDPYRGEAPVAVSKRVRELTSPDDRIFVWGVNPEIYVYSGRVAATRLVICTFLTGSIRADVRSGEVPAQPDTFPISWVRLFEDFERSPPAVFVDSAPTGRFNWDIFPVDDFPRLAEFLRADYELDGRHGGYDVWVRRDHVR